MRRAKSGLSVAKSKLYKTAQLIPEAWEIPTGFKAGEFVAVRFLRVTWGCCIFQCTNASGNVAEISEMELANFVL